jgi:transcription elongation factor GreA
MTSKKERNPLPDKIELGKAATEYLLSLTAEDRQKTQLEINKFVRWYGEKRILGDLTAHEVESYAGQITASTIEPQEKLDPVKTFLSYAHKQKLTRANLSVHLKVKKTSTKMPVSGRHVPKKVSLTAQGFKNLKEELNALQNERPQITAEIRKAAADKDFRENAPLEAAKEYQGKVEARIKELEATLQAASIIDGKHVEDVIVTIGDTIVITDLAYNEQIQYTLVDTWEADPGKGKISVVSPIGQALLGHHKGDEIKVNAPAGVIQYKIDDIISNQ